MKYSPKQAPPHAFLTWLDQANACWKPTYADLAGEPKHAVRDALLEEQGHVCCYCGRALPPDLSDGHIDHFWPQSKFNGTTNVDRSLDYNNFFRSCGPPRNGDVIKRRPITCGDAKGDWFDNDHYAIPSEHSTEARFQYGQSGEVLESDSTDKGAINMIDKLALNEEALKVERQALIAGLEAAIKAGDISVQEEVTRLRTPIGGKLSNFGHVLARYLEVEFSLA